MLSRVIVLIVVCCLRLPCGWAQSNLRFTSYGINDGLPQSSVWSIVQDKPGFLWIGTSDGICRFDGYTFTTYRDISTETNVLGTYACFYKDSANGLWLISQNGICYYNRLRDKFETAFTCRASPVNSYNSFLGENSQYVIAGLSGCGIVKIDKRTRKVVVIKNDELSAQYNWHLAIYANNEIWLTRNSDESRVFNLRTNTWDSLQTPRLTYIVNLNDSELIAVGEQELVLFKKKDHSYRRIPVSFYKKLKPVFTGIVPLPGDDILFTSSKGIFCLDRKTWKVTRHIQSFDQSQPESFAYVQCGYRDVSGNIWIGTNGDGLKKLVAPHKNFKLYNSRNPAAKLPKGIYADETKLYVGYYDAGVEIFDRKGGLIKYMPLDQSTLGNAVRGITAPDSNNIIVRLPHTLATYRFAGKRGLDMMPAFRKLFPGDSLTCANPFFLQRGDSIVANVSDIHLASFRPGPRPAARQIPLTELGEDKITCGFYARDGALWIGTMKGVVRLANGSNAWLPVPKDVVVKTICQDGNGKMWIGTVKGIFVIDSNRRLINYYTENKGLPNNFIYGILKDDKNNMWFSHNKGLSVYLSATGIFRHFTHEDGLQSNEFNTGAYFKAADGELFFGGINGVNAFHPSDISDNPHLPTIVITSIKLFDLPLKIDTAYWNVRSLTLPFTENSLSFEFAALEYTSPLQNRYAYMMEGVDKGWINSGDRRFARYAALPPGHYVFKVKASNNDGIWQKNPATISIYIVPPFWQRWWFRAAVVVLLAAALAFVIILIQRYQHKKRIRALELQQKIQLERQRISRDLHDTVGTQLSLISNNIEWVTRPLKPLTEDEKAEKLRYVNNTARDIIATLRETIWALNKQQITLEEFSDKLKMFVQKQLTAYPELVLNYTEDVGTRVVLGPSEALNLFRICQEAIANSLKYAGASQLNIDIANVAQKYRVTIADNGSGFDISAVDRSVQNGLENMRYRVADIGCALEIRSAPGHGTSVTVIKK